MFVDNVKIMNGAQPIVTVLVRCCFFNKFKELRTNVAKPSLSDHVGQIALSLAKRIMDARNFFHGATSHAVKITRQ